MATGILLPQLTNLAFSASSKIIIANDTPDLAVPVTSMGPWAPPQWSKPALTILTVPGSVNPSTYVPGTPVATAGSSARNYVFDAVIRASHRRTVRKTQHPVISGANISDHAYNEPAKLTLEIGMSDAMASFASSGAWVGWSTKSVSAWQILKGLQTSRALVMVQTRLDTYDNMLIEDCFTLDENKTLHGLRATIIFGEIITAGVLSVPASSARSQTSGNTSTGTVQGFPPDPSQLAQYALPSASYPDIGTSDVPGAGNVSSNNFGQVPFIP
jgi:hypothetical protein